eukprot:scaffold4884_cov97-Cylindrotheca_fusiformis.AAC.1
MGECIRLLKIVDLMKEILPLLEQVDKNAEPDDDIRDKKNEILKALHEEDMKQFSTRRDDSLRKNVPTAYAMIYADFCSSTMQIRIKEHPEFETTIYNDPIELLKAVKMLMHNPVRATYPYLSVTDAWAKLINVKQKEDESLNDYVERFKQVKSVAKSHLGEDCLDKF